MFQVENILESNQKRINKVGQMSWQTRVGYYSTNTIDPTMEVIHCIPKPTKRRCVKGNWQFLPVSNYTEVVWKSDLHNFFHMVKLRSDDMHNKK